MDKASKKMGDEKKPSSSLGEVLSLALPVAEDEVSTAVMRQVLASQGGADEEREAAHREQVIHDIRVSLETCLYKKGEVENKKEYVGVYPFGSQQLGVCTRGSDIDLLCVGPKHLSRDAFFTGLASHWEREERVADMVVVRDAFVPVLGCTFRGVSVDMVYASLPVEVVTPELNIHNHALLREMDEYDVRSLNGVRVGRRILELVPEVDRFRDTLRFIKCWAKRRGLYSNMFGFPGGVSWAILTARVCQLFPRALPNELVRRFFWLYKLWTWPAPLFITEVVDHGYGHVVWQPNKKEVCTVLTPVYPCMNSTHNVSEWSLRLLRQEWQRGSTITDQIRLASTDPSTRERLWRSLLEPSDFFHRYKDYLQVSFVASTASELQKWSGTCESKLRLLILHLSKTAGIHPHLFPQHFCVRTSYTPTTTTTTTAVKPTRVDESKSFFIGLEIEPSSSDTKVKSDEVEKRTLSGHAGVSSPHKPKQVFDLTQCVREYQYAVSAADHASLATSSLRPSIDIRHVRAHRLPDCCFKDDPRPRPVKQKKVRQKVPVSSTRPSVSEPRDVSSSSSSPPPPTLAPVVALSDSKSPLHTDSGHKEAKPGDKSRPLPPSYASTETTRFIATGPTALDTKPSLSTVDTVGTQGSSEYKASSTLTVTVETLPSYHVTISSESTSQPRRVTASSSSSVGATYAHSRKHSRHPSRPILRESDAYVPASSSFSPAVHKRHRVTLPC